MNYKTETSFEPFKNSFSDFWQKKNTLRLLLFNDEIEVKNPLGDIAGVYKLGMFYFSVLNPVIRHNSSLKNIFLVAVTFSEDIRRYGINSILKPIV